MAARVPGWPQWPLARALSLDPVLLSRCSAQLHDFFRTMSKSLRDESQSRADARAARAASTCCGQSGRCACFYDCALLWTNINISVWNFACPLSGVAHLLLSLESLTLKYLNVADYGKSKFSNRSRAAGRSKQALRCPACPFGSARFRLWWGPRQRGAV